MESIQSDSQRLIDQAQKSYLLALISGQRRECEAIVGALMQQGVTHKQLYLGLIQKTLYEVGHLWEIGQITVAAEHLASALSEALLARLYPDIFSAPHGGQRAVIACAPGEQHKIAARIVADFFELHGWHGFYLADNVPQKDLIKFIEEREPEVLGFSLTLARHLPELIDQIDTLSTAFPDLQIIAGGQAFQQMPSGTLSTSSESLLTCRYKQVLVIPSLDALEGFLTHA